MKYGSKNQALSIKIRIWGYLAVLLLPAFVYYTIHIFPNLTLDAYGELAMLALLPAGLCMFLGYNNIGTCLAIGYFVYLIHAVLTLRAKRVWPFSCMLILLFGLMLLSFRGCSHFMDNFCSDKALQAIGAKARLQPERRRSGFPKMTVEELACANGTDRPAATCRRPHLCRIRGIGS